MTHRERASQVAAAILALKVAAEDMAPAARELVWTALVCASNDELARRRDVEAELDRAQRLQAALEVRNAELEG
ncbi:MAG TPA: hypothetical protein VME43_04965, partial [Bryobacteraceae bacterium]|nr:hypothetical protein [Bryobacteraceae bacterium]